MKIAVIGAGAAGLVSGRHIIDQSLDLVIYESSDSIGGTWKYNDDPEKDRHTSMYKNLRINLPKELMAFEGLGYDFHDTSFCSGPIILNYLKQYTEKFDLEKYIKFNTSVTKVSWEGNKWLVTSKNVISNDVEDVLYDSVLVCNGHYSDPIIPNVEGAEKFKGKQIHSHYYRVPEAFKDQNVLSIGMGPSGQDIAFDLACSTKKIFMSHHSNEIPRREFPENAIHKPDVNYLTEDSVVFKDGTKEVIDCVVYCTGYKYSFPFLDDSCGIKAEENYVKPLYKHFISIPHPSMAFIGLPFKTLIFPMFELQVKSFLSILLGKAALPSTEAMLEDTRQMELEKENSNVPLKRYHMLGSAVRSYLGDVAKIGNTEPLPEVYFKIHERSTIARKTKLASYREEIYTIIDDENFIVE